MSILIIGEDLNREIQKLYHTCGVYRTECWKSCECLKEFPADIDAVVLLQDECNYPIMAHYKRKATEQGIPYVCVKNPKKAKAEFVKLSDQWYALWHSKVTQTTRIKEES